MDEDDKNKPTDLNEFKQRKTEEAQKRDWENGEGFRWMNQPFVDADFGIISDKEMPIVMLIPGFGEATGIRMSIDDAEKIGMSLIQAAGVERASREQGDDEEAG